MREKKSMKKISDADVIETYKTKNRAKHRAEIAAKILDKDLFAVNTGKDGLKAKREKLAKDRFKRKNVDGHLKSKTELALKKKILAKGPVEANSVKKEVELFDVWGDSSSAKALGTPSNRIQKFKDFTKKTLTNVKAVAKPHAGQSVNPSVDQHRDILMKVVKEEEKEIEDNYKGSGAQASHGGQAALQKLKQLRKERESKTKEDVKMSSESEDDEEDSSDEEQEEEVPDFDNDGINKPIDRLKKLTISQRNQKKERAERNKAQIAKAQERKMAK